MLTKCNYQLNASTNASTSEYVDKMQLAKKFKPGVACSSGRDRTAEFRITVRSLKGRNHNGHLGPSNEAVVAIREASQFMDIARSIGKDITSTYTKLEKLTLLAKRKTIFDDKPVEIQELTYIIKQDIAHLNKQIGQLQTIAKSQRKDQGNHQAGHSSSVVVQLQSKLATMSNNFKQVLEVRTENLKSQRSRAEQFSSGGVTSSLPASATQGYHAGSVLAMEDDMAAQQGGDAVIDMGGSQLATINHDQTSTTPAGRMLCTPSRAPSSSLEASSANSPPW